MSCTTLEILYEGNVELVVNGEAWHERSNFSSKVQVNVKGVRSNVVPIDIPESGSCTICSSFTLYQEKCLVKQSNAQGSYQPIPCSLILEVVLQNTKRGEMPLATAKIDLAKIVSSQEQTSFQLTVKPNMSHILQSANINIQPSEITKK